MRRIAVVDAPSNLGLRPPTATSVPGCAKAPGALRDHNLLARLGARDAGCITPPRYDPAGWQPGDGVAQAAEIAVFVRRLADRIGTILASGDFPLVLGGDCSILLGAGLAMRRHQHEAGGRIGLIYVDGHSDFRHEGNASYVGAAAGEALALATGRGQANLSSIEQRRPYFRDVDVALLGIRTHDEYRLDLQAAGIVARAVPELRSHGAARSAQWARDQLRECAGFWVHIDVDVLDPAVMPAVDAPDVGGIAYRELEILLSGLVSDPRCLGAQVTVFDPDYDPDGQYAAEVTDVLVTGLEPLITSSALAAAVPDPVISAPPFAAPVSAPPVSGPPLITPRIPTPAPPFDLPSPPPAFDLAPPQAPDAFDVAPVQAPDAFDVAPVQAPDAFDVAPAPAPPAFDVAPAPEAEAFDAALPLDRALPDISEMSGIGWSVAMEDAAEPAEEPEAADDVEAFDDAQALEEPEPEAPGEAEALGEAEVADEGDVAEDVRAAAEEDVTDDDVVDDVEPAAPAVVEAGESGNGRPSWMRGRGKRAASLSLDSLPRDSMGPGGLRPQGGGAPIVASQGGLRRRTAEPAESPLTDVVPAARTPVDEDETTG